MELMMEGRVLCQSASFCEVGGSFFFFFLLKKPLWPSGEWEKKKRQRDSAEVERKPKTWRCGWLSSFPNWREIVENRGAGHCIGCRGGIAAEHEGCLSYFSESFAWAPTPPQLPRESALMCHESRRQIGEEINKWMEMKAPRVLSQIMGRREKGGSAGEMKAGTERGNNVGKKVQLMAVMHFRHSRARLHPHN